jgi:hypothetical protein
MFIGITQPNEKMMSLWGVRYLIADHPLLFGSERVQMPVPLSDPPFYNSPIRLYELSEPNLGNYSPTEIMRVKGATEMLAVMRRSDFDGKRMVVTDADIAAHFAPARAASMTLIEGGLALRAESDGDSILVLPVQYSHCWTAKQDEQITLFRANLMQLGVRFSGRLSSEIKFTFGPFWNSYCRRQDARDADRLDMVGARIQTRNRAAQASSGG